MTSAPGSTNAPHGTAALPSLELSCFGPPTARVGGEPAHGDVLWRKNFALLACLALAPDHARSREHLIGLLWPEKDGTHARRSLNEAVRRLRRHLGAERITSSGTTLWLNDQDLTVDALDVAVADPREAIALMRGDFLEGWVIEDSHAFEEWLTSHRSTFDALAQRLMLEIGDAALGLMDLQTASDMARRALDVEPYSERAARLLMMSQAQGGDGARALATFKEFALRIENDLNEHPSADLAKLRDRVEAGEMQSVAAHQSPAEPEPPLVGRGPVHQAVFGHIEQGLHTGPRVVVVTGEPGFGRTRLLEECLRRAALGGAVTAVARPLESDHDAPYSTLRMLLQEDLAAAPGVLAADGAALGLLAGIEPRFAPNARAVEPQDTSHVARALRECVEAITDEQPLVIAVDDAQYADALTLAVLRATMRQLDSAPVILVLTAPSRTDAAPKELLALRAALGRELPGTVVELNALDVADVELLVGALAPWCMDPEHCNRLARRLTFETQGSPLFIVTLLRALREESELRNDLLTWPVPQSTLSGPLPIQVPDVVLSAIAMRIGSLDDETAQVLKAASLLGQAVLPELLAATLDLSEAAVHRAVVTLEKAGFVVYKGSRPVVAAPLIAEAIGGWYVTSGERRRLRTRIVDALERLPGLGSRVDRARMLADAGRTTEAFDVAIAAATEALTQGAPRTARRSLQVARRVSTSQGGIDLDQLEDRVIREEEKNQ